MVFDHGFGRRYAMPMFLEELRQLPQSLPGLTDTGFYVGGFNWFVDWIVLPAGMALLWISPKRGGQLLSRVMAWGLRAFSRPPYGTLLRLEADGCKGGEESRLVLTVFHPDGYLMTAAPMAACLLQMLDGSARQPGVHLQAWLAEPSRLLQGMRRMGVEVTEEFEPLEEGA
jgi:saccharopine dehydrogenase (NAD+, L-lysine-forming)